ncbi:hypothetical protein EC991_011030 [Linnemannia zychae]|nr:hypothetical protein EC991_011030 [Linnemannia zychae]
MLTPFAPLCQLSIRAWLWGTLYLLTATTLSAQTAWKPTPVAMMAYATVDEKTLYVHGGNMNPMGAIPPQYFSLDLTQDNWEVSNPPWKQLPYSNVFDSTVLAADHALTVSQDGRMLTMWHPGVQNEFANYSIAGNKWTRYPVTFWFEIGLRAATDPTTGTVYFPGAQPGSPKVMVKVDRDLNPTTEAIPSSVNITGTPNNFVWNKIRNSFILDLSGLDSPVDAFHEYTPSNGQWKTLPTTGPNPRLLSYSCMVSAYEGTKMIVFGGLADFSADGGSVGDIYILDMHSMTWTKGRSAPTTRNSMACTVAGDNFISWGGYSTTLVDDKSISVTGTPLIYNIHTDQWVQKYVRGSSYKPPSPSPSNGSNPPGDTGGEGSGAGGDTKGINVATVGGGVAGGVIVVVAIAFIFIRRRRQGRDHHRNSKHPEYIPHNEQKTKHPECTTYHDQELPSLGDKDTRPFPDTRFDWTQIQETPSSPQVIRNNPQGTPSSPHSVIPPPLASFPPTEPYTTPALPIDDDPSQSLDRQKRVRSMDQQLLAIQEQIGTNRSNPQFYPTNDEALSGSSNRGPQLGGERGEAVLVSDSITQDLQYQIQVIRRELSRRGVM